MKKKLDPKAIQGFCLKAMSSRVMKALFQSMRDQMKVKSKRRSIEENLSLKVNLMTVFLNQRDDLKA